MPKGTDFKKLTKRDIVEIANLINNRPRKRLEWKIPLEVYWSQNVALGGGRVAYSVRISLNCIINKHMKIEFLIVFFLIIIEVCAVFSEEIDVIFNIFFVQFFNHETDICSILK